VRHTFTRLLNEHGKRLCTRCQKIKSLESFQRDQKDRYGRQQYCKACRKAMRYGRKPVSAEGG
jgi:hypothetical protein